MTFPWIIGPGLLALAVYLGFFVALFGWLARFIRRRVGWSLLVVAPAVWGACEWLKSSGPLGCTWGNVSYALAEHPAWIQGASIVGAPGLSIWIVCVNALLAGAITVRRWPARVALVVLAIGLVAAPVSWGEKRIRSYRPGETVRVAMIQPNIGSDEKWDTLHQERSIGTLARLTSEDESGGLPDRSVALDVAGARGRSVRSSPGEVLGVSRRALCEHAEKYFGGAAGAC